MTDNPQVIPHLDRIGPDKRDGKYPLTTRIEEREDCQREGLLIPWEVAPYSLFTWWDMEKFSAEEFFRIARMLQSFVTLKLEDESKKVDPKVWGKHFVDIADSLESIGLRMSLISLNRLISLIQAGELKYTTLKTACQDIQARIQDEMSLAVFFHLPNKKHTFYEQKEPLFGKEVHDVFPSAVINIEEAGKCYALGRNTACVFHLQGVMQCGLNALGDSIDIPRTENRTWDAILSKIDPELSKKYTEKSEYFHENEQFCAESAALLRAVKIAWRNPTMHVEISYDEEKALDVYNSVRTFMRHLSTRLKEKRPEV
jgi:hypothetical protein